MIAAVSNRADFYILTPHMEMRFCTFDRVVINAEFTNKLFHSGEHLNSVRWVDMISFVVKGRANRRNIT